MEPLTRSPIITESQLIAMGVKVNKASIKESPSPMVTEYEAYLSTLGFSLQDRDKGISTFNSKEWTDAFSDKYLVKVYIWNGCTQVDLVRLYNNGVEKNIKNLIWGWITHSLDDVKMLFSHQVDLRLLTTVDAR